MDIQAEDQKSKVVSHLRNLTSTIAHIKRSDPPNLRLHLQTALFLTKSQTAPDTALSSSYYL